MIWLVFGTFGDWYPNYSFMEELDAEMVVVNLSYFPVMPKLDKLKIERYFAE